MHSNKEVKTSNVEGNNQTPTNPENIANATGQKNKFVPIRSLITRFGAVPIIVVVVVLLGTGAAAYFGVLLPNNPNALWKRSMSTTVKAMDAYVEYTQQFKDIKGSSFNGAFKTEISGFIADGSFEGETYETNAEIKADFGAAGSRVNAEVLLITPEKAENPDIYIRAQGLEGLSSVLGASEPEIAQLLNTVNNQWYVIDHTLLDQMNLSQSESNQLSDITPDEIYETQSTIIRVTNEYVFGMSPDKSIMYVQQALGKEELDGRKVQHYAVGVNKANLKQYITTLEAELKKTKIGNALGGSGFKQILGEIDTIEENDSFEVWIDSGTQLIRKVKITDKENNKNFIELSLRYDGGTVYPLQIYMQGEEDGNTSVVDLRLEIDTEKKTNKVELLFEANGDTKANGEFNITIKAGDEPMTTKKPLDAKSIYKLLGLYESGDLDSTSSQSTPLRSLSDFDL